MIIHILSDGREVESVEGFVIPTTGATAAVYHIIAEHTKKHNRKNSKKDEGQVNATV